MQPTSAARDQVSYIIYKKTTNDADNMPSFKILFVPVDSSAPVEERVINYEPEDEVRCLTKYTSSHFSKVTGAAAAGAAEAVTKKQLEAEAKKKGMDLTSVQDALAQLSRVQMSDIVPLGVATESNDWMQEVGLCEASKEREESKASPR